MQKPDSIIGFGYLIPIEPLFQVILQNFRTFFSYWPLLAELLFPTNLFFPEIFVLTQRVL